MGYRSLQSGLGRDHSPVPQSPLASPRGAAELQKALENHHDHKFYNKEINKSISTSQLTQQKFVFIFTVGRVPGVVAGSPGQHGHEGGEKVEKRVAQDNIVIDGYQDRDDEHGDAAACGQTGGQQEKPLAPAAGAGGAAAAKHRLLLAQGRGQG